MNVAAEEAPPITSGTLERTPLSHLFIFLHERRLSGTLELAANDENVTVSLHEGHITKVQTSHPVAYLGALLYEQGLIDAEELNASLAEMVKKRKLHGEVLIARGSISPAALEGALEEQSLRKLTHALSFPKTTIFSFHHNVDRLEHYARATTPIDPAPAIFRSVRDAAGSMDLDAALERIGQHRVRLRPGAEIERLDLFPEENAVAAVLRERSMTIDELSELQGFGERRAKSFVYGLLIMKQLEVITSDGTRTEISGAHTFPTRTTPDSSGVMKVASLAPPSTGRYVVAERYERLSPSQSYVRRAASSQQAPPQAPPRTLTMPNVNAVTSAPRIEASIPPPPSSMPSTPRIAASVRPSLTPPSIPKVAVGVRPSLTAPSMPRVEASTRPPPPKTAVDELRGLPVKSFFEGAKLCLARGQIARAERLCRLAEVEQPEVTEVAAMLIWIDALLPENQGVDATRRRLHLLDRLISRDDCCTQAFFFRGQLHKRIENHGAALRDFRQVLDLDSLHADATREVRLYEHRIRNNAISVQRMTPAAGIRRQTPTGMAAVKK